MHSFNEHLSRCSLGPQDMHSPLRQAMAVAGRGDAAAHLEPHQQRGAPAPMP